MSLIKTPRERLTQMLVDRGFKFSDLVVCSEGDYASDDSDWNYKDIPHLHHVHELAEALPAVIGRDIICSINLQSILGIWFPVTLVNYELEKNRQIYFTTLFFFALIIETRSETLAPIRTRVTTRYSIGYPKWLFFVVPVLKALLRKNYKVLMSADLPMRERRGELRKLGYSFVKDGETYSFDGTLNIMKYNVVAPAEAVNTFAVNYVKALAQSATSFIGDRGLLGARLVREGDHLAVYRRSCPHEGASLDEVPCVGGVVTCRWHGRKLSALAKIPWGQPFDEVNGDYHIVASGDDLTMTYVASTDILATKDQPNHANV